MSRSSGVLQPSRWRIALPLAVVIAGVTALVVLIAQASQGADPRQAYSHLVEIHVEGSDEAGIYPFDGVYGTATTPDLSKPSDEDNGDFSDPDGVMKYVKVTGTQVAATSWDAASGQLTARGNMTAVDMSFNGIDGFIKMGSIDAYANCVNGTAITAYSRNDGSQTSVLGHKITNDRTQIPVTGADLNLPKVATGTLNVTVKNVENIVNQPSQASAEAYTELSISAEFKDEDGKVIFDGPMTKMKLGHVYVSCMPLVPPTPSSSSPSVSPTASPTLSPSESPTASPTESPTASPTVSPTESPTASPTESPTASPTGPTSPPTASPTSSSASPTGPPHPTGPTTPPHPTGTTAGPPTPLPVTGSGLTTIVAGSLAALFAGVVLLVVARRQREKRS